jgi:rhodanese-related sulfurtransferase
MADQGEEEVGGGRWTRARRSSGGRSLLGAFLVIVVVPILIGAAVVLLAGRTVAFEGVRRLTVRKFPNVQWTDGASLARWREDAGRTPPVILDARTPIEYQVSHLPGALLMDARRPSLRPLRGRPMNAPIVVYASTGYRGARLAHFLETHGYTNVLNLSGGIFRWADDGRPVVRDGRPATEVHPYDQRWGLLLESRYRARAPAIQTPFAAP